MGDGGASDITRILSDPSRPAKAEELLPLVYEQLRSIARQRMGQERSAHTLQATALVHEAYARLVGSADVDWQNRGHFFAAAAEAMRRILIEHARKRGRIKRGGDRQKLPLNVVDLAAEQDPEQIVAVDEAIRRLEAEDARAATIVRLRFYAGLSVEQTALALGVSERTVMREWAFARAWLFKAVGEQLEEGEPDAGTGDAS